MISRRLGLLYRSHGATLKRRLGNGAIISRFDRQAPLLRCAYSQVTSQPSPISHQSQLKNPSSIPQNQRRSRFLAEKDLENATNALLKTRPGSLDSAQWRQAKKMLDVWSKKSSIHTAKKAHEVLERLVKEAPLNNTNAKLTATMYNQCMNAFRKSGDKNAAGYVNAILEQMQVRHLENPDMAPEPDTISYSTLIHTYAVSDDERATQRAEELIHEMEERFRNNPNGAVNPNTFSYNLVILTYANRIGEYGAAKAAEDWLLRLSELNIEDGPRPDSYSFNHVLMAWANSQEEKGPDRALEILRLFIKLSNEGHEVTPDASSFTTVIASYAKRGQVMKAQDVLYLTREVDFPPQTDLTPCFNAVIDAWAKNGAEDAGQMAETVLRNAISYSAETDSNVIVRPNAITYTSCLDAHTKSSHPHALENAEDYLWRIIDSFRNGEWKVGPTTLTFTCIINAWARSDRPNRAQKAESWLRIMQDLAKNESFRCRPNASTFNICLDAWSRSNTPNAADRAGRILREMETAFAKGDKHARPIGFSYRTVIKLRLASGKKKDALEALFLVKRMEEQARRGNLEARPDTVTCNKVIHILTQIGDEEATRAALNLVRWMDQAYRDGLTFMNPDAWSFTTVMGALSKLPNDGARTAAVKLFGRMTELDADENIATNLTSNATNIALASLPNLGDRKLAADVACSIVDGSFRQMGDENNRKVLDGLDMNTCLQTVLQGGSLEYTLKAHGLLKQMIEKFRDGVTPFRPLRKGFTAVVDALSMFKGDDSIDLIQEIIEVVNDVPFEGHFDKGPGSPFYCKVIDFFVEHDKIEKAEQVLLSWEEKCSLYENVERPNVIIWNKLIRAWSKSSSEDKVRRARKLLIKMREGGVQPDLTTYNTVLNAAAFAMDGYVARHDALSIAISTYEETKSRPLDLQPDEVTYGTMLKAVARLMIPGSEKTELAKSVFEECCANGQDGSLTMKEIGNILSDVEISEIREKTQRTPSSPVEENQTDQPA